MIQAWIIFLSVYAVYALFLICYIRKLFKKMSFLNDDKVKYNDDLPGFTRKDYSKWSKIHFYIGALFLLPIRCIIVFPSIVLGYVILKILSIIFCTFKYNGRMNRCFKMSSSFVVTCLCRFFMFVCGFYWITFNKKKPQLENTLYFENLGEVKYANIICNHTSWADIFFFLAQPRSVGFISNKDLKSYCFVGPIAQIIQCVFVDRKNKESRKKCFEDLEERTKNIKKNPQGNFT